MFAERFEPYHSEDTAWQQHHSTFNLQTLRKTDCQDFQNSGLETQPYCVQTDGLELVACYEGCALLGSQGPVREALL